MKKKQIKMKNMFLKPLKWDEGKWGGRGKNGVGDEKMESVVRYAKDTCLQNPESDGMMEFKNLI